MRFSKAHAALCAVGLSLAILCAGCASWERRDDATSALASPSPAAAVRREAVAIAPATTLESLPGVSNAPEDFLCADGSRLQVSYRGGRDAVAIRLDRAASLLLHRVDETGAAAYRGANLVFRRSGVRAVLAGDLTSLTVESGDTLSLIALRIYGDRKRAVDIARLNNIENPDLIFAGQALLLPQVERHCWRAQHRDAGYFIGATNSIGLQQPLNRRLFSPPTDRQPDLRRVRASAADPPLQ